MRDVTVTTRDNINLATDVYLPLKSGSFPTIVYRTPYDKDDQLVMPDSEREHRYLEALLENGYTIVKQDKRGRFKSDGAWNPVFFDQEDGYDTVE